MDSKDIIRELCRFPQMTTVERKMLILKYLWNTTFLSNDKSGDVVEIGCCYGQTSVLLTEFINSFCPDKELWVFDTFNGLLGMSEKDSNAGMCQDGSIHSTKERFLEHFKSFNLEPPRNIFEGDVRSITQDDLPDKISFCYIDLDIYEPTKHVLPLVWERLKEGGTVIIDDYYFNDVFNGIKVAVDEFIQENSLDIVIPDSALEHSYDDYFAGSERSGLALAISKCDTIDFDKLDDLLRYQ